MLKRNIFLLTILVISCLGAIPYASGQGDTAKVIQSQDTNSTGVVADLVECKRKDGVLRIKVRFRNTTAERAVFDVYGNSTQKNEMDKFYVTAASKKYFVLKDAEGTPLMSETLKSEMQKDGTFFWWGKFPAPPSEVKEISLTMPKVTPFEDVPITD
jgi:hypothetical protein